MSKPSYRITVDEYEGDRNSCDTWQVVFSVGNQFFHVGPLWDVKAEAQHYARTLKAVLKKITT